jgi:hypothetical protein
MSWIALKITLWITFKLNIIIMEKLFATGQFTNESLTALEEKALSSLIKGLQAEPGFSDMEAIDIARDTGIPPRKLRSVISSLVKKEYIYVEPTENWGSHARQTPSYEIIHLQESKWYLHPEWKSKK